MDGKPDLERNRNWESPGTQKARPAAELCWEEVVLRVVPGFSSLRHLASYDKPKKREFDCPSSSRLTLEGVAGTLGDSHIITVPGRARRFPDWKYELCKDGLLDSLCRLLR